MSTFTREEAWRCSPKLDLLPEIGWNLESCTRVAVVVAPHPDDETLGLGGTLHHLARAGWPVRLVAVTDGERSHPRSPTTTPAALARLRAAEQRTALDRLGLAAAPIVRLHESDGAIDEDRLADGLTALLAGADWCLACWRADGHPDHDATGRAAARACAVTHVKLAEYPIWGWHWQNPTSNRMPWERARRVPLDGDARQAKQDAVAAYRSQTHPLSAQPGDEPVVSADALAHFHRPFEILFE